MLKTLRLTEICQIMPKIAEIDRSTQSRFHTHLKNMPKTPKFDALCRKLPKYAEFLLKKSDCQYLLIPQSKKNAE